MIPLQQSAFVMRMFFHGSCTTVPGPGVQAVEVINAHSGAQLEACWKGSIGGAVAKYIRGC